MTTIPANLITGIPRIDKEHQALVDLIDWTEDICDIGNAMDCRGCILSVRDTCNHNLDTLLGTLRAYMAGHFRYEERLMADLSVPMDHRSDHQAAHRLIERRFADIVEGFARERNAAAASRQVVTELRAWLGEHLKTFDADLASFVGPEDHG